MSTGLTLSLRLARATDAHALSLLADLDEQPKLAGEVMLALIGDQVVAAISLEDGRVLADPFVATEDAVSLLRLRARQLRAAPGPSRRRRLRLGFASG